MIITFCGHRELYDNEAARTWLEMVTENLIVNGAETFYLGGYGAFDRLAASVLAEQKKRYPHIELVLILPYLNRRKDISPCDSSLYPPLESVPKKLAIVRRNQWMVEQADVVVDYVLHSWGGAAMTLEYAKRKKKRIISFQG
ncbi:hypothetical protein H9X85_12490 [Anaerotignum lactatifermentans]|uniref:DUF1273 domain-containing protein n=1 Tax=Anaerotignum lactatifermentans TaxID=160404 RepID=A0ABS2GE01_9FIRM|nr:hypothetical protein [Anaerotignum lactatifermentans]MBM6830310.1 hypothetical protein [Anaerotignum lactatifermentans]MBM6878878.1 hypothetical protein [Anaerotignum lactatifermentans]MBM6951998.1 hypothetical protein [Anaerotignum lactatifermentans]